MAFPLDIAIVNPGAEDADLSAWVQVNGSTFRRTATPTSSNSASGTARTGSRVFNWGSASQGIVRQTVDISSLDAGDLADIDAGLILADFEAWLNCEPDGTDRGMVTIRFLASDDSYLGGWQSNAYNEDNWTDIGRANLIVPANTRKITIDLAGVRSGGDAYVDVSFDDIKVTLKERPSGLSHEVLFKCEAQTGDEALFTSNRTDGTQVIAVGNAGGDHWGYYRAYKACTTNSATADAYVDIAIPSGWNSAIDAGATAWYWNFKQHVDGGEATMRTYWDFLDGADAVIGSRNYSDASEIAPTKYSETLPDVWTFMAIPVGCRKVRFGTEQTDLGSVTILAFLYSMQFAIVNETPPPPDVFIQRVALENAISDESARFNLRRVSLENAISDETARFTAQFVGLEVARSLKPRKTPLVGFTLSNDNS